jgi:hypothetical protein
VWRASWASRGVPLPPEGTTREARGAGGCVGSISGHSGRSRVGRGGRACALCVEQERRVRDLADLLPALRAAVGLQTSVDGQPAGPACGLTLHRELPLARVPRGAPGAHRPAAARVPARARNGGAARRVYLLMMSAGDLPRFLASARGQERGAVGTEAEAEAKSEVKAKPPAAVDLLRFLASARARAPAGGGGRD